MDSLNVITIEFLRKHVHTVNSNRSFMRNITVKCRMSFIRNDDVKDRSVLTYSIQLFDQRDKSRSDVFQDMKSFYLFDRVVIKGQMNIRRVQLNHIIWKYLGVSIDVDKVFNSFEPATEINFYCHVAPVKSSQNVRRFPRFSDT